MPKLPSPIQFVTFYNHQIYIKRDDLIHKDFSGNKARKFHYFLDHEFAGISKLISYGSSQSNAMYSLSVLAQMRGWEFEYYVDHLSSYLEQNPQGNYQKALQNSMQLHIAKPPKDIEPNTLFIEEGGRIQESSYGIYKLAQEIANWMEQNHMQSLHIFLPSGTGTTALFLAKYFAINNINAKVFTTPCVGGKEYLAKQFAMLEPSSQYHPTILEANYKHHFGKLYKQEYQMWLELKDTLNIEFDLLYDPYGWIVMMEHIQTLNSSPLLYIHQGGILGNESMLPRYERKYKQ